MTTTGALLRALGVGVAGGLVARLLMRMVVLVRGEEPSFSVVMTAAITSVFVLAALGAATAGSLRWHWVFRAVLVAATSLFLAMGAVSIGVSELEFSAEDGLSAVQWTGVIASAIAILAISAAMPWLGYRLGRRALARRTSLADPAPAAVVGTA